MLNLLIYDRGTKFRIYQVDDETKKRVDVSRSYRLVDLAVDTPDGRRLRGFFFGEDHGPTQSPEIERGEVRT